jgi:MFS transporter, DHA1 family, inner membrane transport protein
MKGIDKGPILPIASMVIFSVLSAAVFLTLPLLVGAMVDLLGLSTAQAGLIAAADMLGATVSALFLSFVISRGRWRAILVSGICLLTIADAASGFVQHFLPLFLCRIVAGLGEGILLTISNSSIGETPNPDRVFGLSAAGQVAFGSPALYLIPSLLMAHGLRGVFWSLAAMTAAAAALVKHIPNAARVSSASPTDAVKSRLSRKSIIGLLGVFTFFIAQGGVWAYLDRIGIANHIDAADVAKALATSSVAAFLGACLPSWLDVRWGRLRPLLVFTLLATISLLVLNEPTTFAVFTAMASLLNFAWNAAPPYQFGALAQIDPTRRTVAFGGALIFAGLSTGPVIAAIIISDGSLRNVGWMGMAFCMLSFSLFGRLLVPIEQTSVS